MTNPPPAGIYIHIPFCARKCLYCDFYSITNLSRRNTFLDALFLEITATKSLLSFDSLYIGGGTPSILPADQIGRIIDRISGQFNLDGSAEITLEVNPGTVTLESLKAYRKSGVTRLNIGVQSFQDSRLGWLGRMHSADAAKDAILWARAAGFDQIGMDLIYGLPGQSRKAWLADLHQAISFDPEHLSCYMLTCEPETPLDRMRQRQEFKAMTDEDVCGLFETTVTELSRHGYPLYEISNFARKDNSPDANRSRHNQKYWTDASYLGFGPAAHSYLSPVRYRNHRDISAYISDLNSRTFPIAEKETLSREQQLMETVFLGLRTLEGISIRRFEEKSDRPFNIVFQDLLTDPELKELITLTPEHCSLTLQGMMVLDAIAGMFVDRI
ncbi:MAG: radical SAM family heme chaperone HemW [Deltaproteobacteria bacterium]|nr:radical SAM family heme chaperone HemW [Deltaproteobacteria bacterium]